MTQCLGGLKVRVGAIFLATGILLPAVGWADEKPALFGYGVRSCDDFIKAWDERAEGIDQGIAEYRRYEDWLAGFVSGLNLATGQDVLRGAQIEGAMRRAQVHCDNKRKDDFFTATMDLVKMLSQLR